MERQFYVCKHCGKLFSGNGERLRGVMCIGCCEQATHLCTFSWWEGLDLEARRTLVEEYAPSVQLTNDQLMQIPYRRREASPASPQATQAVPTPTHVSRTVAGQPSQNTSWSAPPIQHISEFPGRAQQRRPHPRHHRRGVLRHRGPADDRHNLRGVIRGERRHYL